MNEITHTYTPNNAVVTPRKAQVRGHKEQDVSLFSPQMPPGQQEVGGAEITNGSRIEFSASGRNQLASFSGFFSIHRNELT